MTTYAILVLGIARSGTSALAGTLAHMGIPFGDGLKPIDEQNAKGNYEHMELSKLNQQVLKVFGSNWSDHNPLPHNWIEHPEVKSISGQMASIIDQDFSGNSIFGIKDPRLVPLFPLYFKILQEKSIKSIVVASHRNKENTLVSIAKSGYYHGEFTYSLGNELYEHYSAGIDQAIALSGGIRIDFEDLLYNTEIVKKEILQSFPKEVSEYLEQRGATLPEFIDVQLHHHKA